MAKPITISVSIKQARILRDILLSESFDHPEMEPLYYALVNFISGWEDRNKNDG